MIAKEITDDFEILIVDDSPDYELFEFLKQVKPSYPFLRVIKLSKNFGQHAAILAGLEAADGDLFVITDCGMREAAENILTYFKEMKEGNLDLVIGVKRNYSAPFFKRNLNRLFWWGFNKVTDLNYEKN